MNVPSSGDEAIELLQQSEAAKAARKMLAKKVSLWVALVAGIGGFLFAALNTSEKQSGFLGFLDGTPTFLVKAAIIIVCIVLIERGIKWFVSRDWFDQDAGALEQAHVRNRIGTEDERRGDAQANATVVASVWVFRGLFILAYFYFYAAHSG